MERWMQLVRCWQLNWPTIFSSYRQFPHLTVQNVRTIFFQILFLRDSFERLKRKGMLPIFKWRKKTHFDSRKFDSILNVIKSVWIFQRISSQMRFITFVRHWSYRLNFRLNAQRSIGFYLKCHCNCKHTCKGKWRNG